MMELMKVAVSSPKDFAKALSPVADVCATKTSTKNTKSKIEQPKQPSPQYKSLRGFGGLRAGGTGVFGGTAAGGVGGFAGAGADDTDVAGFAAGAGTGWTAPAVAGGTAAAVAAVETAAAEAAVAVLFCGF